MKVQLKLENEAVHFLGHSDTTKATVPIDGSPDIGGQALGVRPMELVLMAVGSCSALDLLSILRKQRQEVTDLQIEVDSERVDAIPAVFSSIHIIFRLKGEINLEKAKKAAELAVKKYCSVHDMLAAGGVDITYEVNVA
ncbi:OsmC family protein [Olivibacter sitiensis]|uniref:OsmC family protein n=1 Tax=Olivibacter sitiensis TaxID=376470 RepID=UPI00040300EE|nr:OsmC family protein [Olivibacter sitiensis]